MRFRLVRPLNSVNFQTIVIPAKAGIQPFVTVTKDGLGGPIWPAPRSLRWDDGTLFNDLRNQILLRGRISRLPDLANSSPYTGYVSAFQHELRPLATVLKSFRTSTVHHPWRGRMVRRSLDASIHERPADSAQLSRRKLHRAITASRHKGAGTCFDAEDVGRADDARSADIVDKIRDCDKLARTRLDSGSVDCRHGT